MLVRKMRTNDAFWVIPMAGGRKHALFEVARYAYESCHMPCIVDAQEFSNQNLILCQKSGNSFALAAIHPHLVSLVSF